MKIRLDCKFSRVGVFLFCTGKPAGYFKLKFNKLQCYWNCCTLTQLSQLLMKICLYSPLVFSNFFILIFTGSCDSSANMIIVTQYYTNIVTLNENEVVAQQEELRI